MATRHPSVGSNIQNLLKQNVGCVTLLWQPPTWSQWFLHHEGIAQTCVEVLSLLSTGLSQRGPVLALRPRPIACWWAEMVSWARSTLIYPVPGGPVPCTPIVLIEERLKLWINPNVDYGWLAGLVPGYFFSQFNSCNLLCAIYISRY